jgi:putative transposase
MKLACAAVGLGRASAYRHLGRSRQPPLAAQDEPPSAAQRTSARRIPDEERARILAALDSERFIDQPPREVYGALLSEGIFMCSWRTMYRVLAERAPVRERRNQREAKSHAIPRLIAASPNQVWSWDISKLATYERGVFLNLYVVIDLFSRYVVAWMVAAHENSALAQQLFREAIERYAIDPGTLIVHQDRGAPMTSHGFAELLAALGVERSYSRPRVSDDNPFSESHFHTMKYQPDYPGRFRDIAHAREWCSTFFTWYNDAHHHDGLALFTPAQVFQGHVERVAARRQEALNAAYLRNPERFVSGPPAVARPPSRVLLNPLDAAPPTVDSVLAATSQELEALWPAAADSGVPMINLPGAPISQTDAATAS